MIAFLATLVPYLTLFETIVLTWQPARVVLATCMREGQISQPREWSEDSFPVGLSWNQYGHVSANSVRQ